MSDLPDTPKSTPMGFTFNNHPLTILEIDGVPHFIAREVGAVLGYDDNGANLVDTIRRNWSEELVDGRHLLFMEGERLAALKVAINIPTDRRDVAGTDYPTDRRVVAPQARHLLLLTEPGLYRVLMLAGGPVACRFRDWLDSEVLPSLRRTGTYTLPGRAQAAPTLPDPSMLPEALQQVPGGVLLELLLAEASTGRELPKVRGMLCERGADQVNDRAIADQAKKLEDLKRSNEALKESARTAAIEQMKVQKELASFGSWYDIYKREHERYSAEVSARLAVEREAAYNLQLAEAKAWMEVRNANAAANEAALMRARGRLHKAIEWLRSQGERVATRGIYSLTWALEARKSFPGRDTAIDLCRRYHVAETSREGAKMLACIAEIEAVLRVPVEADQDEAGGAA